jgi:hypothetical protein
MEIMAISLRDQKMLWGRSASRCAFTECRRELVMDATTADRAAIVGEVAHIVSESPDGPRGNSHLTADERSRYANLILLCNVHHQLIDDQPNTYSVDRLLQMKNDHEGWVRTTLRLDPAKQNDEEVYALYAEQWAKFALLSQWRNLSFGFLSAQPQIGIVERRQLGQTCAWLLGRVWPDRYAELRASFDNFRQILQDLLAVFDEYAVRDGDDLVLRKFYQIDEWNPEQYRTLLNRYEFIAALIHDLMCELTRAANFACDRIRHFIDPGFRVSEGYVQTESGPDIEFKFRIYTLHYRGDERVAHPYPGLEQFKRDRRTRDLHFGEGVTPDDPIAS